MEKLMFVINDGDGCYNEYVHTGVMPRTKRRFVEIKLTESQKDKLRLSYIGKNGNGKDIYEKVESINIQDGNK